MLASTAIWGPPVRDKSALLDRLFIVRIYIVDDVRLKSEKLSQETRAKEVQSELYIVSATDAFSR